jgi:hypothetical protein
MVWPYIMVNLKHPKINFMCIQGFLESHMLMHVDPCSFSLLQYDFKFFFIQSIESCSCKKALIKILL